MRWRCHVARGAAVGLPCLLCLVGSPHTAAALRLITFGDSYTDFDNALQSAKPVLGPNTVHPDCLPCNI